MKKILIGIFALVALATSAQQEAMYTHYAFNTLAVNPGYAGSRDALTITGLHRSQWVGFEGAPTTQTITLHAPVFNEKVGLGLSVLNDKIGPINTTSIYADFAYKLPVGTKGKLAFGLKGGVNLLTGDLASVPLTEGSSGLIDNAFQNNVASDVLPNFGFGMYYSTTKWYAGISTPKLLENDFENNTTGANSGSEARHYYFVAGTVFNLNQTGSLKLKPTTFVKVTNGAPVVVDITTMLIVKEKVELGLMARSGDAVGLLLGYNFSETLRFGYSFDWSLLNSTGKYNGGSHEVMLRYDFVYDNKLRIKSPRYF